MAFANTAGGTLIIGRADDGAIVGVDDVLTEEERLASLISDSMGMCTRVIFRPHPDIAASAPVNEPVSSFLPSWVGRRCLPRMR